jgi:hypothetical protein
MKQAEHCGLGFVGQLLDAILGGFVEPAVAARFLDADVEPDRRIEAAFWCSIMCASSLRKFSPSCGVAK